MQDQSSIHYAPRTTDRQIGAIYVHVPFCLSKCGYCDFYSLADASELAEPYLEALGAELQQNAELLASPLDSIFIGGGTPTALEPSLLGRLLAMLTDLGDDKTEFSIEANPCTVTDKKARMLGDAGVNRVNLGAQSFVQGELAAMGRIHDPDRIVAAWETLRSVKIERLGLDLIYAAPGQNLDSWRVSLDQALDLRPDHLSCYALTVEPDTAIGRLRDSGEFVEMDDSDQADCYQAALEAARAAGLERYEISNFAAHGKECRHNLTYWRNEPYLGLGPAAASYIAGVRRINSPDVNAYIRAIDAGRQPPGESERITGRAEMAETLMLALRMSRGADRQAFAERFGMDPTDAFAETIKRYCDQGAMLIDSERIRIAPQAMLVSNTIIADILAAV
jgi:oxygen-independent coproporphyrinogen III oxidase